LEAVNPVEIFVICWQTASAIKDKSGLSFSYLSGILEQPSVSQVRLSLSWYSLWSSSQFSARPPQHRQLVHPTKNALYGQHC